MGALRVFAEAVGVRVAYVKPHGALYNASSTTRGRLPLSSRPCGRSATTSSRSGCEIGLAASCRRGRDPLRDEGFRRPRLHPGGHARPAGRGRRRPLRPEHRHPGPRAGQGIGLLPVRSRSPALSRRHAWPAHRGRDEPGPRDLRRLRRRRPRRRRRSLQYVCRGGRRAPCPDDVGGHLPGASPISPAHAHKRGVVGDGRRRPGRGAAAGTHPRASRHRRAAERGGGPRIVRPCGPARAGCSRAAQSRWCSGSASSASVMTTLATSWP